ncbi:hypothetical protein [Celeribacter sp.]|uniref:hypothetical protein n=1 Tax=Celeribacter sp. TaxID=1890673 RepID=UPI003A92E303
MEYTLRNFTPLAKISITATFFGGIAALFWRMTTTFDPDLIPKYALFLAALVFLTPSCVESAHAMWRTDPRDGWRNPYRWMLAFHIGYAYALTAVILMTVPQMDPTIFPRDALNFGISGLVFGGLIVWRTKDSRHWDHIVSRYDTAAPRKARALWRGLYFASPVLIVTLLTLNILPFAQGEGAFDDTVFMAILMHSILRAAEPDLKGGAYSLDAFSARAAYYVGLGVLLFAYTLP